VNGVTSVNGETSGDGATSADGATLVDGATFLRGCLMNYSKGIPTTPDKAARTYGRQRTSETGATSRSVSMAAAVGTASPGQGTGCGEV